MIEITFEDEDLLKLYNTKECKNGKYKKLAKDRKFIEKFIEVVSIIAALEHISDLSSFGRLHYEKLKYDYSGKSSVRIIHSRPERLIFKETPEGIAISILELNIDHYGKLR